MNKIRKGDEVIVTTGKDKGKRGAVLTVQADGKLLVEGVNLAKKHMKPNPMKGEQGGVVDKTMPIHASNVALFDSKSGKGSRVSIQVRDGERVRVLKSSDTVLKA
jgi:large subunit ribosomal protein L24